MISADLQRLSPGHLVEMFVLDTTNIGGGEVLRFHAGVNDLGNDVVWQGETYSRYPVEAEGFELSGSGKASRPLLRVANVTGSLGAFVRAYDDLVDALVTRKRTFLRYLDAVNFAAGNPQANPAVHLSDEVYRVDRKANENNVLIEWEMSSALDLSGLMLPRRQTVQNVCPWRYRGAGCGYTGGPVADIHDTPTTDPDLDVCGKRLTSCKLRFGATAPLPFGGFPGAGLVR